MRANASPLRSQTMKRNRRRVLMRPSQAKIWEGSSQAAAAVPRRKAGGASRQHLQRSRRRWSSGRTRRSRSLHYSPTSIYLCRQIRMLGVPSAGRMRMRGRLRISARRRLSLSALLCSSTIIRFAQSRASTQSSTS